MRFGRGEKDLHMISGSASSAPPAPGGGGLGRTILLLQSRMLIDVDDSSIIASESVPSPTAVDRKTTTKDRPHCM